MKYIVSEFEVINKPKPKGERELSEILSDIKTEKYKSLILSCRNTKDKDSLESAKRKLPLFTPTGNFSHRSIAGIKHYNGIICLDIDHIDDPEKLKSKCKNIPFVYSAFTTPSGKGLKVLIKTDATIETYKNTELKVASKFTELTGAERDNHCKDIARVQYVSYDPEIYINENSEIFKT